MYVVVVRVFMCWYCKPVFFREAVIQRFGNSNVSLMVFLAISDFVLFILNKFNVSRVDIFPFTENRENMEKLPALFV